MKPNPVQKTNPQQQASPASDVSPADERISQAASKRIAEYALVGGAVGTVTAGLYLVSQQELQ